MKQSTGFGVVGILEGEEVGSAAQRIAPLGCEALIRDWQQLPNGLLGIRVEGGRRFTVEGTRVQADQLTLGDIAWLDDDADRPLLPEHADLAALLNALAEHPLVKGLGMGGLAHGQQELANQLAYLLPFSLDEKLELLALGSPDARLDHLQTLLNRLQGDVIA
jgi:hypothetical protein